MNPSISAETGLAGDVWSDEHETPNSPATLHASPAMGLPGSCPASIDLDEAARTEWGVLVIGAGPAGALTARQTALLGLKTLLIDKCSFPRAKVCGGCISGRGRQILKRVGLGHLVEEPAATALSRFDLATGGRGISLALPLGAAVSRSVFDAALVREAMAAGADFLSETTAQVRGLAEAGRLRGVSLQKPSREAARARSRLILVADGLGRTSLKRHGPFKPQIASGSRVGLGCTVAGGDCKLPAGTVSMSVGRAGYVGMVRVPGGFINVAAAVDSDALRERGPAAIVRTILEECGVDPPAALLSADWRGTGLLTRHGSRLAGKRLLLLGDAAGYVEPFTGEGMTWAMLSAVSAAPLAKEWLAAGQKEIPFAQFARTWSRRQRRLVARHQRSCRALAWGLRHPSAVRTALGVFSLAPGIASPLIHYFWNQKDLP